MERHIWGDDWTELQAHIERQRARMTVARVPIELIEAFADLSNACFKDQQRMVEKSQGEVRGIRQHLLASIHGS